MIRTCLWSFRMINANVKILERDMQWLPLTLMTRVFISWMLSPMCSMPWLHLMHLEVNYGMLDLVMHNIEHWHNCRTIKWLKGW